MTVRLDPSHLAGLLELFQRVELEPERARDYDECDSDSGFDGPPPVPLPKDL